MSVSPHQLLEYVVAAYDERDCPVTPAAAAEQFDTTPDAITDTFERLANCELVRQIDGGYRPTVTGRELLALDLDDGVVVVDPE